MATDCGQRDLASCYGEKCLGCDPGCELQECGISVIREKQREQAIRHGRPGEMVTDAEYMDGIATGHDDYIAAFLADEEKDSPPDIAKIIRDTRLDTLRHLAHYWAENPRSFDTLMREAMLGKNRSDYAKELGCTRQNITKLLRTESNERFRREIQQLKNKNSFLQRLTPEELGVYQLCFIDGVSIRSAAKQLRLSPAKTYRLKQRVRLKLTQSETLSTEKKKKKRKKYVV